MESFEDLLNMLERPATKSRAVKRKWREIEAELLKAQEEAEAAGD